MDPAATERRTMKILMLRDDGVSALNLVLKRGTVYDLTERVATRLIRAGAAVPQAESGQAVKCVERNVPDQERIVLNWNVLRRR